MKYWAPGKKSIGIIIKRGYKANIFDAISSTKVTRINVKKTLNVQFYQESSEEANDSEWGAPYFTQPNPNQIK